jgi:hypothetical protein
MKAMPLAIVLVAFGAGWLLAPVPAAEAPLVQARRETWRLPDLPQRSDQAAQAIGLASSPIFEPEAALAAAAAAAAVAKAEDKRWRVSGIFGRGNERKVLINFALPGKEPLRLAAGDKVPSGERIVRILDGEVLIQVGKKQVPLGAGYRE